MMLSTALFEKAKKHFQLNKPFVLYRKPTESQLNLLIQNTASLHWVHDYTEKGFVMAPFTPDLRPILIKSDHHLVADFGPGVSSSHAMALELRSDKKAKSEYLALVSGVLSEIKAGRLSKVVVSRKLEIPYESFPLNIFQNLLFQHADAFCYLWFHPEAGLWLGASPELLMSFDDCLLTTYALAGTQPFIPGNEPQWNIKEIEEQEYVTHFILDQLSSLNLSTEASDPVSVRAGKIWHLKSEIKAHVPDLGIKNIIKCLHPTPAVCGLPKPGAIEFILKHENYDRKFYTGFLGELNLIKEGQCDFFVNLRCMEWRNNLATLFVGGGITNRSVPEAEWEETEHKSQTILDAAFNSYK